MSGRGEGPHWKVALRTGEYVEVVSQLETALEDLKLVKGSLEPLSLSSQRVHWTIERLEHALGLVEDAERGYMVEVVNLLPKGEHADARI